PLLEPHRPPLLFEMPRDPLGPPLVYSRVADEEVGATVAHAGIISEPRTGVEPAAQLPATRIGGGLCPPETPHAESDPRPALVASGRARGRGEAPSAKRAERAPLVSGSPPG